LEKRVDQPVHFERPLAEAECSTHQGIGGERSPRGRPPASKVAVEKKPDERGVRHIERQHVQLSLRRELQKEEAITESRLGEPAGNGPSKQSRQIHQHDEQHRKYGEHPPLPALEGSGQPGRHQGRHRRNDDRFDQLAYLGVPRKLRSIQAVELAQEIRKGDRTSDDGRERQSADDKVVFLSWVRKIRRRACQVDRRDGENRGHDVPVYRARPRHVNPVSPKIRRRISVPSFIASMIASGKAGLRRKTLQPHLRDLIEDEDFEFFCSHLGIINYPRSRGICPMKGVITENSLEFQPAGLIDFATKR